MKKISLLTLAFVLALAVSAWAQATLRINNGPNVQWVNNGRAQIAWSTPERSAGQDIVRYGTDPNNLSMTASARQDTRERNGSWNHMAQLENLQPGATYYFQVESQGSQGVLRSQVGSFQANGNATQSGAYNPAAQSQGTYNPYSQNQGTYTAGQGSYNPYGGGNSGAVRINNGPNVEKTSGTSATISWSTNMPGESLVRYGTDPNNLGKSLRDQDQGQGTREANGSFNHRVMISGLKPNTTYFFVVETAGVRSTPSQFRTE